MNYKEKFGSTDYLTNFRQTETLFEKIPSVFDDESKMRVAQLEELINKTRTLLNVIDYTYVTAHALSILNNQYSSIRSYLQNFINSNNVAHLRSMDTHISQVNIYLPAFELYLPKRSKDIYISLDKFKMEVSKTRNDLNEKFEEEENNLEHIKRRLDELDTISTKIKKEVELSSNTIDTYLQSRQKEFDDALEQYKKDIELKLRVDYTNVFKKIREESETHKEEIGKIAEIVATTGTTAKYTQDAKDEKNRYERWRKITVSTMFLLIIASALIAYNIIFIPTDGWEPVVGKLIVLSSISAFLGYSSKIGAGHRKQYLLSNQLALEHATLIPFLSSLDPSKSSNVREILATKYFGSTNDNIESSNETQNHLLIQLLEEVIKRLPTGG